MTKFDKKKLRMLSPDAEDWNQIVGQFDWLNQENSVYGVVLYPRKGIRGPRVEREVIDFIEERLPAAGHGCLETQFEKRGNDWAVLYHITAWYNHFDLNEEYD
jgi:hypothetical protein